MRRIVNYTQSAHLSDVQISPQWHQWLRHTRADPPSLSELTQDLLRQEKLKALAAAADAKWTSKSNLIQNPGLSQDHSPISLENQNGKSHPLSTPKIAISNDQVKISHDR